MKNWLFTGNTYMASAQCYFKLYNTGYTVHTGMTVSSILKLFKNLEWQTEKVLLISWSYYWRDMWS